MWSIFLSAVVRVSFLNTQIVNSYPYSANSMQTFVFLYFSGFDFRSLRIFIAAAAFPLAFEYGLQICFEMKCLFF